jgi:hypothetical protein
VLAVIGAWLALGAAQASGHPHYVPTHVPKGFRFVDANNLSPGASKILYAHGRDNSADLWVETAAGECCSYTERERHSIIIRGHRGKIARLVDYDEGEYTLGRVIAWEERPGVYVAVFSAAEYPLHTRVLKRIAEDVATVSDGYWHRLIVGTRRDPLFLSELPGDRKKRFVKAGRANGHRWELRTLVPRGFPLGWYDLRTPCSLLSYRDKSTYGFGCTEPTSWMLIRGQIFVFGVIPRRVRHVRIEPYPGYEGSTRTFTTIRRRRLGHYALYVAAMPRDTCHVVVWDADRDREIGPTGPIFNDAENHRCNS